MCSMLVQVHVHLHRDTRAPHTDQLHHCMPVWESGLTEMRRAGSYCSMSRSSSRPDSSSVGNTRDRSWGRHCGYSCLHQHEGRVKQTAHANLHSAGIALVFMTGTRCSSQTAARQPQATTLLWQALRHISTPNQQETLVLTSPAVC